MNSVYFLDFFLFVFVLQYIFYFEDGLIKTLVCNFKNAVSGVFGYELEMSLSFLVSYFIFVFLLLSCFGGYFVYSFCPCGMIEFTFFFSVVAWLSTILTFISSDKFSIYMSKEGDGLMKSFSMLLVEIVSEFSRPVALTVRLTVNVMVGHLISMSMYNFLSCFGGVFMVWLVVFAIMMECFVFFIQSYIFSRLIYLYLNE